MAELLCAQCLEPWDNDYIHHELRHVNKTRFLRGAGCEACDFGQSCPACHGTGRKAFDWLTNAQEEICTSCLGSRYLIIRQLVHTDEPAQWEYGYQPRIQTVEDPEIIARYRDETTLDGPVRIAKAHCPAAKRLA